jgi:hypothetical protein
MSKLEQTQKFLEENGLKSTVIDEGLMSFTQATKCGRLKSMLARAVRDEDEDGAKKIRKEIEDNHCEF